MATWYRGDMSYSAGTYCGHCKQNRVPDESSCASCADPRPTHGWPVDSQVGAAGWQGYIAERRLGAGSFGTVYEIVHPEYVGTPGGLRYAWKVLAPELRQSAGIVERFRTEARLLVQMRHPHIVECRDYGVGEAPNIVLEFIAGGDLHRHVRTPGEQPRVMGPARVATIGAQIAAGLACAHNQPEPVVHRDLKPANVLISKTTSGDDSTTVKIVDFGIAKILGTGTTRRLTSSGGRPSHGGVP